MHIIAFLTDPAAVRAILVHLGEPTAPPRIAPARGPPLWDLPDAGTVASTPTPSRHRSTRSIKHRLVTPTVDSPRTTLGRRVPEVPSARSLLADPRQTPAPGASVRRGDP
jgi:hypothetical protein